MKIIIIIILLILIDVCNGFILSKNVRKLKQYRTTMIQMSIQGPVRYGSNDWILCLSSLPTSRILKKVQFFVLFTTIWSASIVILKQRFTLMFPILKSLSISTIPHSLASTALGLLLVFRTNASYDR